MKKGICGVVTTQERAGEKRTLKWAAASTFVWGALTYFYAFLNFTISHDSLNEFISFYSWKISLGRFLGPIYQELVRGRVTIIWPIGLIALAMMAVTVYALARMARFSKPWQIALTAGAVVTSPPVFLTAATYIHDFDVYALALLFAVLAVCAWRTGKKRMLPVMAVCVTACMGLYQSYLSITVTGVMLLCILRLLDGTKAQSVLIDGLKAVAAIAAGLLVYALAAWAMCAVSGVSMQQESYNSITNAISPQMRQNLWRNIAAGYRDVLDMLTVRHFGHGSALSIAQCAALAGALAALVYRAVRARLPVPSALLLAALVAAFPLGVNLSMVANNGWVHDLMRCGVIGAVLLELALLVPLCREQRPLVRRCAALALACMGWVMWQNVVDANQVYIKKDLGRQATLATMVRVTDAMEEQEEYAAGETPVLFIGIPASKNPGFPEELSYLEAYVGVDTGRQIITNSTIEKYCRYVLRVDLLPCSSGQAAELRAMEQVKEMPAFPEQGYIQMVNGALVVKLENY